MEIRIDDKKEVKPTVGDMVVNRKGVSYVISYESTSETYRKYSARTLDGICGINSIANGYFANVKELWESLEALGFKLYSQEEYELVITKK